MHASGDTFVEPVAIVPRDATRIIKASRRRLTPDGAGGPDGDSPSAAAIPFAQNWSRPLIAIALPPNVIRLATPTTPPADDAERELPVPGGSCGTQEIAKAPSGREECRLSEMHYDN